MVGAPAPDPITAEARGLGLLAVAHVVRVPEVLLHAPAVGAAPAFLVIAWIDAASGTSRDAAGAALGVGLAEQHRRTAPAYGLDHDNYCGLTPQPNGWLPSWLDFYRDRRLRHQITLAERQGFLRHPRRSQLERLVERLELWIDPRPEPPSLLHGDLWGGNWLVDETGQPVLIDPAAYYGDREAELAMCRLFGGFPCSFYDAYDAAWPPLPGRHERVPLYQIYHLLNHLNLFGEVYGAQVDAVLRRYVG